MPHSKHGTVVLMGSGEMMPSMVETHKLAMSWVEGPLKAVFIDTPAGFQLNADLLGEKAIEFFTDKLNTPLEIATFKSAERATPEETQTAASTLMKASYIFAGPGSPTYALNNWRGSPLPDAMLESLSHGGCLTFASAASLTLGKYTIPIYEVYKVGESLRWVEGLDILGHTGLNVAVVPHWNNNSGGDHDTRHCFMGEPRWKVLEEMLPEGTVILGIDENTACMLRLDHNLAEVRGLGQVTIRSGGKEQVFQKGDTFSLDLLRTGGDAGLPESQDGKTSVPSWEDIRARHDALLQHPNPSTNEVSAYIYDLMALMTDSRQREDLESAQRAEEALRGAMVEIVAGMGSSTPGAINEMIGPYVELLVDLRLNFRENKQWDQADLIRDRLTNLGIVLEDGPQGTSWRQEQA